jgi:diaminopimelate epimerase
MSPLKYHNNPKPFSFEKFHGNGNDFLFLDGTFLNAFSHLSQLRQWAAFVCHRQFGIGADGVVFVSHPPQTNLTHLLIVNSDGSLGATCGNALRCLGLKLLKDNLWQGQDALSLFRLTHPIFSELPAEELFALDNQTPFATLIFGNLEKKWVTVAMGRETSVKPLSEKHGFHLSPHPFSSPLSGVFVQLANPHLVFYSDDFLSFTNQQFIDFGLWAQEKTQQSALDVPLSNISMVSKRKDDQWVLTVFERGAGLTFCCGSGAVATRIALETLSFLPESEKSVCFVLKGGNVEISYEHVMGSHQRTLSGPAEFVYKGMMS